MLLVVVECLKDYAFHMDTVYVNSLEPSKGCTLQAELSGGGWGIPSFIMVSLCIPHKLFETFVFSPLSAHCLMPYIHRM